MGFDATRRDATLFRSRRSPFHFLWLCWMRDRTCRHIFHVLFPSFSFFFGRRSTLFLWCWRCWFSLLFFSSKKNEYKIWKYEFLLVFIRRRTQSDSCRECELHGKHDFRYFFFLSIFLSLFLFEFYIRDTSLLISRFIWFWQYFDLGQRNDCHRKIENRMAKASSCALSLSLSLSRFLSLPPFPFLSSVLSVPLSLYLVQFQRWRQDKSKPMAKENSNASSNCIEENCNFQSVPSAKWFLYVL